MFRAAESRQKEGREVESTVDLVLRARGNMLPGKANGPEDTNRDGDAEGAAH